MPVDEEEDLRTLSSRERKIQRERDVRLARGSVEKTVRHWEGFFRNHKKYFEVGRVVGLQVPTVRRGLCEDAARQRPRRREN